tara:strand:- start:220465 stop:220572 length:108 start_codon:yes stop_codon:yes gene_type:complete
MYEKIIMMFWGEVKKAVMFSAMLMVMPNANPHQFS